MQDFTNKEKQKTAVKMADFPLEAKQRLVGVFAWLIAEDKKQNPELYQRNKTQND